MHYLELHDPRDESRPLLTKVNFNAIWPGLRDEVNVEVESGRLSRLSAEVDTELITALFRRNLGSSA